MRTTLATTTPCHAEDSLNTVTGRHRGRVESTVNRCRPGPGDALDSKPRTVADAMVSHPKLCDRSTTTGELRSMFSDDHVHAAVIVTRGVLLSVVDRSDLDSALPDSHPAVRLGGLTDRTVSPEEALDPVMASMIFAGRRRLAVVDAENRLLGLLCLKRKLNGFCSDQDVRDRAADPHTERGAGRAVAARHVESPGSRRTAAQRHTATLGDAQ